MSDPNPNPEQHIPEAQSTGGDETHGSTATLPFSDEDLKSFRASDKSAGAAIVVLMAAVFTIGLLMYSYIAYIVLPQ